LVTDESSMIYLGIFSHGRVNGSCKLNWCWRTLSILKQVSTLEAGVICSLDGCSPNPSYSINCTCSVLEFYASHYDLRDV